jgi:hypothetical protein
MYVFCKLPDCHYQMLVFLACTTTSEPKGSDWCRVKLNRISDFVRDFFLFSLNPKKITLKSREIESNGEEIMKSRCTIQKIGSKLK